MVCEIDSKFPKTEIHLPKHKHSQQAPVGGIGIPSILRKRFCTSVAIALNPSSPNGHPFSGCRCTEEKRDELKHFNNKARYVESSKMIGCAKTILHTNLPLSP